MSDSQRKIWQNWQGLLFLAALGSSIALVSVIDNAEETVTCPNYHGVQSDTNITTNTTEGGFSNGTATGTPSDPSGLIENIGISIWAYVLVGANVGQVVLAIAALLSFAFESTGLAVFFGVLLLLTNLLQLAWLGVGTALYFDNCEGEVAPASVDRALKGTLIIGFFQMPTFLINLVCLPMMSSSQTDLDD